MMPVLGTALFMSHFPLDWSQWKSVDSLLLWYHPHQAPEYEGGMDGGVVWVALEERMPLSVTAQHIRLELNQG